MQTYEPNEGIEFLYTRDCMAWAAALQNLQTALTQLGINDEPRVMVIDTLGQANEYNFFASPTIHIHGADVDRRARRINRRGVGHSRPYFWQGKNYTVPPVELIVVGLEELYNMEDIKPAIKMTTVVILRHQPKDL